MKDKKNAGQEVQGGGEYSQVKLNSRERGRERARRGLYFSNSLITVPSASYYLTVHTAYTQIFS